MKQSKAFLLSAIGFLSGYALHFFVSLEDTTPSVALQQITLGKLVESLKSSEVDAYTSQIDCKSIPADSKDVTLGGIEWVLCEVNTGKSTIIFEQLYGHDMRLITGTLETFPNIDEERR